jgi:hypothetical protein
MLLRVDFLYMGAPSARASHRYRWLLCLRDDFSSYTMLFPAVACEADTAVRAILHWFSLFGVVRHIASDRGSSFLCDVTRQLTAALRVDWQYVTAYAHRANGGIERAHRDVLAVVRSLTSEWQLSTDAWPDLIPVVVSALNALSTRRLGGHSPAEVFIGAAALQPVDAVLIHARDHDAGATIRATPITAEEVRDAVRRLADVLAELHATAAAQERKRGMHHLRGRAVDFTVGDYVLVCVPEPSRRHKVLHRWTGPWLVHRCVDNTAYLVYEVQHLLTNEIKTVHADRLALYYDPSLDVTDELRQFTGRQGDEYLVRELCDVRRFADGTWMVRVAWEGFESPHHDTWEPIDELTLSVPALVSSFLRRLPASADKTLLLERYVNTSA